MFYDFAPMQFKAYKQERAENLPPNLDAGTVLTKIVRVEANLFKLNGQDTKGMRVFSLENGAEKEYRTSSGVIMNQLEEFFKNHPTDSLDNVKVVAPRGKQYLTLEEA
jgi:hypothetical protein